MGKHDILLAGKSNNGTISLLLLLLAITPLNQSPSPPNLHSPIGSQAFQNPNSLPDSFVGASGRYSDSPVSFIDGFLDMELFVPGSGSNRRIRYQGERIRGDCRTKVVCTIGPGTCRFDDLEAFASDGMYVARLNLCHNSRGWHWEVIRRVRKLNEEKGFAIVVMVDTQENQTEEAEDGKRSELGFGRVRVWPYG